MQEFYSKYLSNLKILCCIKDTYIYKAVLKIDICYQYLWLWKTAFLVKKYHIPG